MNTKDQEQILVHIRSDAVNRGLYQAYQYRHGMKHGDFIREDGERGGNEYNTARCA